MKNKKQDQVALVFIIMGYLMMISAVILFIIYKDTNVLINSLATALLVLAAIVFFDLKFYRDIRPFWVGIVFALLLFLAFYGVSLVVHHFFKNTGNLIGIPIVVALAFLLHRFEKPLNNLLVSVFTRKGQNKQ